MSLRGTLFVIIALALGVALWWVSLPEAVTNAGNAPRPTSMQTGDRPGLNEARVPSRPGDGVRAPAPLLITLEDEVPTEVAVHIDPIYADVPSRRYVRLDVVALRGVQPGDRVGLAVPGAAEPLVATMEVVERPASGILAMRGVIQTPTGPRPVAVTLGRTRNFAMISAEYATWNLTAVEGDGWVVNAQTLGPSGPPAPDRVVPPGPPDVIPPIPPLAASVRS